MEYVTPAGTTEERLFNCYLDRKAAALRSYTGTFNRLPDFYNMYRGWYTGKNSHYRNVLHIPFTLAVIQSDVARKAQTSFAGWPPVEFVGYGQTDAGNARRVTTLVGAQLEDADSTAKAVDFFVNADLYGTAVARIGWTYKKRFEKWRDQQTILGQPVEVQREGEVTRFDGPDWEVVDLFDFMPQPGARRMRDARWAMHRYYVDYEDLVAASKEKLFNAEAVRSLKDNAPSSPYTVAGWPFYRNTYEIHSRVEDRFDKPVQCIDMIGEVPPECQSDGVRFRLVTIANDRRIIRNIPYPFWHGQLPFLAYSPMPDPHYFHGIGKAEVMYRLQALSNKYASQKADAADLNIDPMYIASRLAGIQTETIITRAGKVITADGPVGPDMFRPLMPDLRGMQMVPQEIAQYWGWMQLGSGAIEDVFIGAGGGGRQTRAEFLGRQENVLTRNMLEARLAEKGFVEPLANMFRQLNKQYLRTPHMVKILGSGAFINPVTGLPLPPEPVVVTLDDINPDYRARAMGATQMLGKSIKQANASTLLQLASSNPVAIQIINWVAFFRQIFQVFDFNNIDELFVNSVPLINQQAQQAGAAPGDIAGAADAAMSGGEIPPELMALLSGGGEEGGEDFAGFGAGTGAEGA